jgi:hypothetical protein
MGEPQIITFSYKELATVLIKHEGIHEGLWSLTVQFAMKAGMTQTGPAEEDVVIAAVIPLLKMGIQKLDKPTPISVDAAEVNPPPKP